MTVPPSPIICPRCGAVNTASTAACRACGNPLDMDLAAHGQRPLIEPLGRPRPVMQGYRTDTLLLVVVVLAVFFALIRSAPFFAVLWALIAGVALALTVDRAAARLVEGKPLTTLQKIRTFLGQVGLLVGTLAAIIALAALGLIALGMLVARASGF